MSNDDGFVDGMIAAVLLGFAAYGVYKVVQNITASPEQKLLQNLGQDLKRLDASTQYGTPVETDYEED